MFSLTEALISVFTIQLTLSIKMYLEYRRLKKSSNLLEDDSDSTVIKVKKEILKFIYTLPYIVDTDNIKIKLLEVQENIAELEKVEFLKDSLNYKTLKDTESQLLYELEVQELIVQYPGYYPQYKILTSKDLSTIEAFARISAVRNRVRINLELLDLSKRDLTGEEIDDLKGFKPSSEEDYLDYKVRIINIKNKYAQESILLKPLVNDYHLIEKYFKNKDCKVQVVALAVLTKYE